MRRCGFTLALIGLTVLSTTAGCAPVIDNPQLNVIAVSAKETGATIDLELHQSLAIRLDSNRTTGYEWVLTDLDRQLLQTADDAPSYETNPSPTGLMGAGGTERWTFQPLKAGDTVIRFEYRRPWENGREAIRSAVFNVRVR